MNVLPINTRVSSEALCNVALEECKTYVASIEDLLCQVSILQSKLQSAVDDVNWNIKLQEA